ncbi:unnamed protein product [Prunus brigantina]
MTGVTSSDCTSNEKGKGVAHALPVAIPASSSHGEKPEKFNGTDFKRWQQKMLFYFPTLNLAKFLKEDAPATSTTTEAVAAADAWYHSDFLCKNYILNGLDNTLYNVYSPIKTAKALWESLDKKYKTEDVGMKKFVVGRFLDFKMEDSKMVINQVQELQVVMHEIEVENMVLNLIVRLRIEEDNHGSEKKTGGNSMVAKAHVVEDRPKNKKKRKHSGEGSSQGNSKKNKGFKGKCFNCNKHGHRAANYQSKGKTAEVHMTEEEKLSNKIFDINLLAVIYEVNLVSNIEEWWVDTGATRHICSDRKMFTTYQQLNQGEQLFMGNSSASKVEGQGKVVLKMTSSKEVTINQVLHVPDIRKNLVFGALLSKNGFRLVFEADKFVLIKNGMYVGKRYLNNGLFKMNVMTIVPSMNNKNTVSLTYILESPNIWHGKLGHVNYGTIRRLVNMNLLPKFNIDTSKKCETCVEAKLTRTSFHSIERSIVWA